MADGPTERETTELFVLWKQGRTQDFLKRRARTEIFIVASRV